MKIKEKSHLALHDEVMKQLEAQMDRALAQVRAEERQFHRNTGARLLLGALVQLGAFNEDFQDIVAAWVKEGGNTRLEWDGVLLFPPSV